MTSSDRLLQTSWVPQACTLPTAEQPLRVREFAEFFAAEVLLVERVDQVTVRVQLRSDPAVAARAAELMMKESGCCSFFEFALAATGGQLVLDIGVPAAHIAVLDALAEHAMTAASKVLS